MLTVKIEQCRLLVCLKCNLSTKWLGFYKDVLVAMSEKGVCGMCVCVCLNSFKAEKSNSGKSSIPVDTAVGRRVNYQSC